MKSSAIRKGPAPERRPPNPTARARLRVVALAAGESQRGGTEDARAAPGDAGKSDPAPLLAGLRVLVVEDEVLVAFEIEDVLGELGAAVVGTALDADEAVRLADSLRPDLVTMDIRIQGDRDGIDAATEIWARFGIRSLLVSAYADQRNLERAKPANPVGLVPKPISKERLAAALGSFRA